MLRNLRYPFIIFVVMTKIDSYGFFSLYLLLEIFPVPKKPLCHIIQRNLYSIFYPKGKWRASLQYSEIITQLLSPQLNHPSFTSLNLVLSELSFTWKPLLLAAIVFHMKAIAISCYHNSVIRFSVVTFCSKTKISKIKTMKLSPNEAFVSPTNDTHEYKMQVPCTRHIN